MDFYTRFERLCSEKGVSPSHVRAELGISQSTMASWKSRGLTPKYDTGKKLADYFGVTVDSLMGLQDYGDGFHAEPGLKQSTVDGVKARISEMKAETQRRQRTNNAFDQMTAEGQNKVADYAEDILPRYRRQEAAEPIPRESESKDTTPPEPPPETPPEGE